MKKSFAILFFLISFVFAGTLSAQHIKGEGAIVTEEIDLPGEIHSIGLGVAAEVYLMKGNQKIKIEGQKNIIDNIKRKVKNGSWNIEFDKKVRGYKDLKIYVSMQDVKNLSIGGSGSIISKDDFNGLEDVTLNIGGSGEIELGGSANNLQVNIAGSGDVEVGRLKAQVAEVSIAGSGDCKIHATENLKVSIAGSGDVRYIGNPKVRSSIAGSGDVRSTDD
ncbi:MAG: DUF2807 domain-containing protein [Bacteroidetes bacterium]|nr:DUF2807 domain-containing protein [Bacteroidota bacterium]